MKALLKLYALALLSLNLYADNWPMWRGTTGVGITTEKHLPP